MDPPAQGGATLTPPPSRPTPTATAAPVGRPDRPHTLSFDEIKATSARANWRIAANTGGVALTGFGLLRWPTGTAEPPHSQAIVVGDGSATQKAMTGLTPATTYVFKMRACNGPNRCSDWTANQTFTTLAGTVTPGRVTNLRHSSSGDNSVTLAWSAPGNSAAAALTGYHVQNRPLESDWPGDGVDVVQGAGTTTFTVSQLVDGTIYEFQVQACNAAGCGAWTELLHPDHVIVAGHKVGNASLIPASASLAVGGRLGVGIHDIPKGKVAYAQMYGAIQPAGQCSTTRGTRAVARAPSASTGSGYYDTVNIEGCAPGGIGWLRVVNAAETELYARATIRVGVPPGKVGTLTVTAGNASLQVAWVAPSAGDRPITHYDLQYRAGTSGAWTLVEDITLTSYTVTGLTNGTSYQVQVRAVSEVGDGDWSEIATGVPSDVEQIVTTPPGTTPAAIDPECPATSADTVPLSQLRVDVVPQAQRQATICWPHVQNATAYVIRATDKVGNVHTTAATDWHPVKETTEIPIAAGKPQRHLLNLDKILDEAGMDRGLAHKRAYGIRIGVKYATGTILYTTPVIIIDTPITKADGSDARAEITWDLVGAPTLLNNTNFDTGYYEIRWRQSSGDHTSATWKPTDFAPPPSDVSFRVTPSTHVIGGLATGSVYALQLIYRDDPLEDNDRDADVFAARNAFVWPSNSVALGGQRVAAFPLQQRLGARTSDGYPLYSYRICTETFRPSDDTRIDAWVALINHAMQQWQTATGGLIRTERQTDSSGGYAPCADYAGLIRVMADEIATFMPAPTPGIDQQLYDLVLDFVKRFKEMGIVLDDSKMEEKYGDEDHTMRDLAANEIIMFNEGHPIDTIMRVGAFTEFAGNVGLVRSCWYKLDKNTGTLTFDDTTAMCTAQDQDRVDSTRDILIRRSKFEPAAGDPEIPLATTAI